MLRRMRLAWSVANRFCDPFHLVLWETKRGSDLTDRYSTTELQPNYPKVIRG